MLLQGFLPPLSFSGVADQGSVTLQVHLPHRPHASNLDFASLGASDGKDAVLKPITSPESLDKSGGRSTSKRSDECCAPVLPRAEQSVSQTAPYSAYARIGLDPPPLPLEEILPDYPAQARGVEGSVTLRILISERGLVDEVVVESSYPKGIFEESAIKAFREARFSPGKILGVPVKAQMLIEVDFSPLNRGSLISGGGY